MVITSARGAVVRSRQGEFSKFEQVRVRKLRKFERVHLITPNLSIGCFPYTAPTCCCCCCCCCSKHPRPRADLLAARRPGLTCPRPTIGEHWTESATPQGSDRLDLYPTVPTEQKFGALLVQSNICDALSVQINKLGLNPPAVAVW